MILASSGIAQLYRDIAGVKRYEERLARIDNFLQLNPNNCHAEFEYLDRIAKKEKNDELKTILLIYKGTYHYYTGKNDSAEYFFSKAIDLATKIKHARLRSSASIRRLFVIDRSGDTRVMLQLMQDEFDQAKARGDTLNMIYSLNGLAIYNERLDDTKKSIDKYLEAIDLAKENNNLFEYGFLLNNFGLLKLRMKSNEDAYNDFKKGLEIAKSLESIRLELTIRENMGFYFMEIDSLEKAEAEYRNTLKIAQDRKFDLHVFNSLVNMAVIERMKGDGIEADILINKALASARRSELYYSMSPVFITMAQIELDRKKYAVVDAYLDSAIQYSVYTSKNEILEAYYEIKYQAQLQRGNHAEALNYYQKLTDFRDSIDLGGHAQILKELQLRYDVEKKEKERVEQKNNYEHKISQQALHNASLKQKIGIVLGLVVLLIGGFVIYYFYTQQKREIEFSNAIVNKLEEERGRIARDLHDGLGQSLVILKNRFNQISSTQSDQKAMDDLDKNFTEVIEEVRSISRSLIPPELRRLGLKKSLEKMFRDIQQSAGIMTTVDLDCLDTINFSETYEIRIYRILQELTNNTMKHAQATALKLEVSSEGTQVNFTYQDNGRGFDHDKINSNDSIGLRSIEQRLRFMHGSIKFERVQRGIKAVIKIKRSA